MTTPTKGMEYVDVHKKWRYEAWHFTPWLAANLDVLSEVLGVKLELVQREGGRRTVLLRYPGQRGRLG